MYDLVIICEHAHAAVLGEDFIARFHDTEQGVVLIYGTTPKQEWGFVVIEWWDAVPQEVIRALDLDAKVEDYTIYPVPYCANVAG